MAISDVNGLVPGNESDSKGEQQEHEDKRAYAACDVAMRNKECDVIAQRQMTVDYSRLPPRGRLQYFSGWTYYCADTGVGTTGDCATCLDCT